MIRFLAPFVLVSVASAQFVYDFNSLNGSDVHPFVQLDGQDNWSEQTFNASNRCGVVATMSHDGTPAIRFQEVGPGYGCDASRINDVNWLYAPFLGGEVNASFQADIKVGYWGGSFGLAYDTNGDGSIRGSQVGERGVRFQIGTQSGQQLRLYAADQTMTMASLSNAGGIAGGDWVRVRVVMDFTANAGAGAGSVFVQNLTQGAPGFTAVQGLQDIPLALDQTATDATNPTLWDAVWLHFEGATYSLDNIDVGRGGFAAPFGTACNGTAGPADLVANGSLQVGSTVTFESGNHASSALGVTVFGFSTTSYLGTPLPAAIDPLYGTSGCTLYTDVVVPVVGFTSSTSPALLSTSVGVPANWTGFAFYVQQVCFEAVPGGMSFSNALRVQLP